MYMAGLTNLHLYSSAVVPALRGVAAACVQRRRSSYVLQCWQRARILGLACYIIHKLGVTLAIKLM